MTNYEKLREAFPLINGRNGQIKMICPVPFLGETFCLKHAINGKGMLPREVYDNQTATCVSCAKAYWAFDEDDPSLIKISITQTAPVDITDDDTYARVQHCCDQYRKGAIPFETLKELLDVLNFTVVEKKTSFMEFQKQTPKSEDPTYPRQSGRETF